MTVFEALRVFAVIAILALAALAASDRNRLPLALRGLRKILDADRSRENAAPSTPAPVSRKRRFVAFLLVVAAIVLALV